MTSEAPPRVLVVEDEASLARGIEFNLKREGFAVDCVADGSEAATLLGQPGTQSTRGHDLVILDVMLPGLDGMSVVRAARDAGNRTPVLMLTAKALPEDMVEGLESGADDYLAKPFDLSVLLARVKSLLRRREWATSRSSLDGATVVIAIGDAKIDLANFAVTRGDEMIRLTLLEAGLLRLLIENRGRVVSKGDILEKVWNLRPETETRAVDNFVMRLRRFLEDDPKDPKRLLTIRGAGYRLALAAEEGARSAPPSDE
jgi:DNA-binding response OmpR family regulator